MHHAWIAFQLLAIQNPTFDTANEGLSRFGVHREAWQHPSGCGHNCAYWLLNQHGIQVGLDALLREVPPMEQGISLAQLQRALAAHGLTVTVIQYSGEGLELLPLPLIAHLSESNRSHYVIVTGIEKETVTYLDGGSCKQLKINRGQFERLWSGLAIIHHSAVSTKYLWMSCGMALISCGLLLVRGRPSRERIRSGNLAESNR